MKKLAIVVSRFNPEVTGGLLQGALEVCLEKGFSNPDVLDAPGAFEIPLLAQELARTGRYQGVICLGCVIKGDTAHFEFISLGATIGLQQVTLATRVPVTFGILTTYDDAQAEKRSKKGDSENKGREAALACIESLEALERIRVGL